MKESMGNLDDFINVAKDSLVINVLIKDQKFKIFCGVGRQKIRWLTDAAIVKYESYNKGKCGVAYSIKLENGNLCDLDDSINSILQNNENVWVLFKDEFESHKEEMINRIHGDFSSPNVNKYLKS